MARGDEHAGPLERCVIEDVDQPLAVVGVDGLVLRDLLIEGKTYNLEQDMRLPAAVKETLAGQVAEPFVMRSVSVQDGLPPQSYEFRVDDAEGLRRIRISADGEVISVRR